MQSIHLYIQCNCDLANKTTVELSYCMFLCKSFWCPYNILWYVTSWQRHWLNFSRELHWNCNSTTLCKCCCWLIAESELYLNFILFMLEMLSESSPNLPATTDPYSQITIGPHTNYNRKPSGKLTLLALIKTEDVAGDRHQQKKDTPNKPHPAGSGGLLQRPCFPQLSVRVMFLSQ